MCPELVITWRRYVSLRAREELLDKASLMLIRTDLTFRQWITLIQKSITALQYDNTRITGLPDSICPLGPNLLRCTPAVQEIDKAE